MNSYLEVALLGSIVAIFLNFIIETTTMMIVGNIGAFVLVISLIIATIQEIRR